MIDGNGNSTGSFGVCVENLGPPQPPILSEDCYTAPYLCDTSMISVATNTHSFGSLAEPAYCFPFSITTDPGAYWYQFTALTSGNFCFDIYANDGVTDYDWYVADVTTGCPGFGMDCDSTASAGLVTGLGCGSIACHGACLSVGAGSTYAILVSRRTNNSTGFTLNFTTTTALFGGVPIPTFTHGDSVCVGQSVAFTNTSTTQNQNLTFVWNFGDGYTSTLANPTHAYGAAGTFNITLIATCGSNSNVQVSSITILPPLPASVTPTAATICNGDSVTLIGSATFSSSLQVPMTFTNSTATPIPDFPNPGIQSDIVVSGVLPNSFFANPLVSVCVNITHPEDFDLNLQLRAPDGTQIALAFNAGGFGSDYIGTCFDSSATLLPSITTGSAPLTGQWAPYDYFLPTFNFTPNDGTWSLLIDDVVGGFAGTLNDWSITFNVPNYLTYSWTPSAGLSSTTNDTTIAMPGVSTNYTFIATDATGCPGSASAQVNVTNTPQSTFSINSTTLCIGEIATLTDTGVASPAATYNWNFGSGDTVSGSGAGPYLITWPTAGTDSITLVVQDSSCTSVTTVLYVTINPNPTVSTTGSDTLVCEGASINLAATSSATATYSWTGPSPFSSTIQNPVIPSATPAMTGFYFVFATDNGCPSPTANVFVQVITTPVANANGSSPVCDEATISLTTDTLLGGSYSWSGPNAYSSTMQNPFISPAALTDSGTYTVIVTVAGCPSAPSNTVIVMNPLPVPPVGGSNSPICETSTLDLFTDTVGAASYLWTGPNGFSDPNQITTRSPVTFSDGGNYIVTRTDSGTGCTSHGDTVVVQIDQNIAAQLPNVVSEVHTCALDTIIAAVDPNPAFGTWSLVSGTGGFATPNNYITAVIGVDTGVSVYQWRVVNGTCSDTINLTVVHDGIDTCGTFETNELITPNNDGLNERLIFTGLYQFPQNKLVIFNRWGSEVFSQDGYKNEWRGRTEAGTSGDELPNGTYYYVLTVPGKEGMKGFVEIRK